MPGKFLSLYRAGRVARADARAVASRGATFRNARGAAFGRSLNRRMPMSSMRERNYVDLAKATYVMDTTGSITLVATIAQGAAVTQRIGKKIVIESIQARGLARSNSAAVYQDCAFLLVYDQRPTGSLPAITDILVSASATAFNNDVNSGRFKILKRMDFALTGNTTTPATGGEAVSADFFLKVNKPCVFKAAATGAIGDIEQGAIYLITVGDTAAGTAASAVELAFRVRFRDI